MSTAVLTPSERSVAGVLRSGGRLALQRPDFVALLLALPVFIVAELPLAAYALVAVLWIAQSLLEAFIQIRAAASDDARRIMGLLAGGALLRAWTVASALLVAGIIDNEVGLVAVLLTIVLFTIFFSTKLFNQLLGQADQVSKAQR